jgi:hypothetical protein
VENQRVSQRIPGPEEDECLNVERSPVMPIRVPLRPETYGLEMGNGGPDFQNVGDQVRGAIVVSAVIDIDDLEIVAKAGKWALVRLPQGTNVNWGELPGAVLTNGCER